MRHTVSKPIAVRHFDRLDQTRNSAKVSPQRGSGVMHARQKGNYTVSKPNFAVQIIEMSVSFGFTLCALPRGAVGMHNTALTVHERAPPRLTVHKLAPYGRQLGPHDYIFFLI